MRRKPLAHFPPEFWELCREALSSPSPFVISDLKERGLEPASLRGYLYAFRTALIAEAEHHAGARELLALGAGELTFSVRGDNLTVYRRTALPLAAKVIADALPPTWHPGDSE